MYKRRSVVRSFIFVLLFLSVKLFAGMPEEVVIVRGMQKSFPVEKVRRVSLADEKVVVVTVTRDNRTIILTGKNPGITNLTVWYENKKEEESLIKVILMEPSKVKEEIESRLKILGIKGIEVLVEKDKVLVIGTVDNKIDMDIITKILKNYEGIAENYVILADDITEIKKQIKNMLEGVEGVEVKISVDKIIIGGTIFRIPDKEKIDKIVSSYPQKIINLTELDITRYLIEAAREITRKIGLKSVTAEPAGKDGIVLKGTVLNNTEREDAEKEARAYIDKVTNLIKVEDAMVEINGLFINLEETLEKRIGTNIFSPDSLKISFSRIIEPSKNTGLSFLLAKDLGSIFPEIGKSNAKNVYKWFVATKTGEKAEYHHGATMKIIVKGRDVATTEDKKYGILMEAEPTVTSKGEISLKLDIEISAPLSRSTEGHLTFAEYKTKTTVIVPIGQSLIISGTKDKIFDNFKSGTPILDKIPILKYLFSTKGKKEVYKDMVLIITPTSPTYIELEKKSLSEEKNTLLEEER